MAALKTIAKDWADEIRDGIAWVIVWKTGRSWNAQAVWLDLDNNTFKLEDLDMVRKVLEQDSNAVMLNGYYCGHFGEDMTVTELAAGIRWNYENGCNLLEDSSALPPEPMERPTELPADMPWYGKAAGAEPDPYVYDGYMAPEDCEHMHELMAADQQQGKENHAAPGTLHIDGQPSVEQAADMVGAIKSAIQKATESIHNLLDAIARDIQKNTAVVAKTINDFVDTMLYNANDHPKWWHLYKHAKKARTRKKYRRRLMRQLTAKLAAAA